MKLRRIRTAGAAVAITALALAGCTSGGQSPGGDDTLVIASWGGAFTAATLENLARPFEEATGIKVQIVDAPNTQLTQMQQMVDAGAVQWDILDSLGAADAYSMYEMGLVQKLSPELHRSLTDVLTPQKMSEFGFTFANLGYVIVCNTEAVAACPTTLKEFYDPVAFPGKRELPGESYSQHIAALVAASGQDTMSDNIDLDAAIAVLERVAPSVTVWWTSGDQQEQVIRQGEAEIGLIYSGRAYHLVDEGLPVEVHWSGVYDPGFTAIATNAPHQEAAERFMQFTAENTKGQAGFAEAMSYGVPNAAALEMLPSQVAERLADDPANFEKLVQQNFPWYLANKDEIDQRIRAVVSGR